MHRQRTASRFLAVGFWLVVFLVSTACATPFPSVDVRTLPTHTPTFPAGTPTPTPQPATTVPLTLPASPTSTRPPEKRPTLQELVPTISVRDDADVGAKADALVAAARTDLAQRLSVAEGAITVVSIEEVQWPDTGLGCPQEGMMYAQVITPGYRIVLSTAGRDYVYHTNFERVLLCAPSLVP